MNQYLQIFTYLKEFAKLRNRVIYDIKQYQNIWLDSVKNNDIFYNTLNSENKEDHWLKLKKPKSPKKPTPIKPPKKLIDWIDEKSLYNENSQPFLKDEIILENKSLYLSDHPKLKNILDGYVNDKWLDELLDYDEKNNQYKSKSDKYKELLEIYQKFFKFYEELKSKSDTHELVIGVGLFHYQKDNDSRKYYRHIITQAASIEYKLSAITIQISDEDPKIEKDFISKEFEELSITDAIEYFDSNIDNIDLLDNQNIGQTLEEVANRIGAEYSHQINKPITSANKNISYSPALILRKKNASKFDEAYTKIIEQIDPQSDNFNISLIDALLSKNNEPNAVNIPDNSTLPEIIYFPNPSNKEQAQILEKSKNNDAVLVQGPPGTGKSHTIANLICHLLATGNKVLATAYTKRALEVLKGKLPAEYQGLAVDYLGNDQKSKDNLTASVNTILNNINNPPDYDTRNDEQALKIVKENIAEATNKQQEIIRQDTEKTTINANYEGMLVEILEQLKADKEQFLWYQDNYDDTKDNDLQKQFNEFIALNQTHQFNQLSDFNNIADISKLPTPAKVDRYCELTKFSTIEKANLIELDDDNLDSFENKLNKIKDIKIDFTAEQDLRVLESQANTLLDYLKQGGKLQGLSILKLEKLRLPTEIKEIYPFVNEVKVNNSPCDTKEEFDDVIRNIEVRKICVELGKKFDIQALLEGVKTTRLNKKWHSIDANICNAKEHLVNVNSNQDIDFTKANDYKEHYKNIDKLNTFKNLQQQLSQKIPHTIEEILTGEAITCEQLSGALYHQHAENHVNGLPQEDTAALKQQIQKHQEKEKELITKIGANKAWQDVVDNIDNSLQKELKFWQDAVGKISNTNSKRTQRYRKIAKQKMHTCKDIIPCWIMPLQQLVDTITPKQGMYDYIIIDEASQLNIDAMLLLYLAKKIIIVGDKEQIAPENISIDKQQVENAIIKHLQGIPDKEFYDTEHSFFDLASIHFHQNITLREHFRCMPEIIEFSNKLCYKPNNTPLFPLRAYSEERLEPLKNVFCDDGYTEGQHSNIINRPEAKAVVKKIAEVIKDKGYQNKTIGVITLQGNAQKEIIHNLLLEKIDEKEYVARKIIVGNAAKLQGDERDIIFLSLVTAHNHERRALTRDTDKRRFNVAVSRAKDQLWLFHSVQLSDLKNHNDLRYKLLEHITTYTTKKSEQREPISVPNPKPRYGDEPKPPKPFRSWFEVEVYNDILDKNYQVIPAHKVASYEIDLVPICADGTKVAVECDGDYWHSEEQYDNDMQRQDILERAGWQFFRIRYSEYVRDKYKATQGLWELLEQHSIKPKPTESKTKQSNVLPNYTNQEIVVAESQQELQAEPSKNTSNTSENKESQPLCFFNLYQSGSYILSQNKKDDADLVLAIEPQYKNGYLLQCYGNGHVNKFKVSALLKRSLNKDYKNGFNTKTSMPKLMLLEKDEIIGIFFNELGKKVFKAHLTSKLPEKDNLLIQGYKVIYNEFFSDPEYRIITLDKEDDIKRLTFDSFNARGKPMDNAYYKKEWDSLNC